MNVRTCRSIGLIVALAGATAFGVAAHGAADPLEGLAANTSAVFDVASNPRLMVTETDHGVTATRTLGVGDDYLDGWRIEAITATSATLSKDKARRTVTFTGLTPVAPAAPPVTTGGKVSASNASPPVGGQSQALAAAIAAHNARQIVAAGGTAADVARTLDPISLMTAGPKNPDSPPLDPATATFLPQRPDGAIGLHFVKADGTGVTMLLGVNIAGLVLVPPPP